MRLIPLAAVAYLEFTIILGAKFQVDLITVDISGCGVHGGSVV
jgi:hypothetical protein